MFHSFERFFSFLYLKPSGHLTLAFSTLAILCGVHLIQGIVASLLCLILGVFFSFFLQKRLSHHTSIHSTTDISQKLDFQLYALMCFIFSSLLIFSSLQAYYIILGLTTCLLYLLFALMTVLNARRDNTSAFSIPASWIRIQHIFLAGFLISASIIFLGFIAFVLGLAPTPYQYAHLIWTFWLWIVALMCSSLTIFNLWHLYR